MNFPCKIFLRLFILPLFLLLFACSEEYEALWTGRLEGTVIHVTQVSLDNIELSMVEGMTKTLTATIMPTTATNKNVTWSSSNTSVATVSSDGVVTAKSAGSATITVKTADGEKTASCTVTVKAKDKSGSIGGHEYVDLGLPSGTLWATCNVGAENPEDAGLYFAWGETKGYTYDTSDGRSFNWSSYKWMASGYSDWKGCTKYTFADNQTSGCWYNNGTYVGTTVNGTTYKTLTELLPEDDAATANWGSAWRMPSADQIDELCNSSYTITTWTTQNGVYGRKVTSKANGNTLFLPAAGNRGDSDLTVVGSWGYYWSRSLDSGYSLLACSLLFLSGDFGRGSGSGRCCGFSVRPVRLAAASE